MKNLSDQMEESLSYHKPDENVQDRIETLRAAQKKYALVMETLCPVSRSLAIAKTEFETSCMWAIKSLVLETK